MRLSIGIMAQLSRVNHFTSGYVAKIGQSRNIQRPACCSGMSATTPPSSQSPGSLMRTGGWRAMSCGGWNGTSFHSRSGRRCALGSSRFLVWCCLRSSREHEADCLLTHIVLFIQRFTWLLRPWLGDLIWIFSKARVKMSIRNMAFSPRVRIQGVRAIRAIAH